jgi:vacuolar-type H+-ATPase subunit E/Vma4
MSLESIVERILEEAEKKKQEILEEARFQAAGVIQEAKKEAERISGLELQEAGSRFNK